MSAPASPSGCEPAKNPARHDYITNSLFVCNIELTTWRACTMYSPILAHLRGRLPETRRRRSGEWRPAAAARNRRPPEARDPARQSQRPGCEELAALIRRKCGRRKRGPRPKIATVE